MRGGQGGNGCLSFRREKYVPRGGPNGGDGGDGGDVIIQSDASVRTLLDLHYHSLNFAERGVHGKGKDMHGKRGQDLVIRVPAGTVCKDAETDEVLWDFEQAGECFVAAHGGRGGKGNARFATATNRAPRQATPGTPGEERWLLMELKLLADVGLLGFPKCREIHAAVVPVRRQTKNCRLSVYHADPPPGCGAIARLRHLCDR